MIDIEYVRNTVSLGNIRRMGGRGWAARARPVLGAFITVICLILIAMTVLGGLLMLLQWVAMDLPPNLLLPCSSPEGCARLDHGERSEFPFDSGGDAVLVVP
jgi:hypothetical protein